MGRRKKTNDTLVEARKIEEIPEPKQVIFEKEKPAELVFEYRYFVAHGVHLNSRRGILPPGEQVTENDFPGGEESVIQHVSNGIVVSRKVSENV